MQNEREGGMEGEKRETRRDERRSVHLHVHVRCFRSWHPIRGQEPSARGTRRFLPIINYYYCHNTGLKNQSFLLDAGSLNSLTAHLLCLYTPTNRMDACSLLCAPTLGRSVRHGQIIRSRAVRLSSRCSSSNTAGDSNGHSHAIGCFMLLLMLALNRALTDWHDNSPFNSPPPLAVTLSLPSLLSFVLSSNHLSY